MPADWGYRELVLGALLFVISLLLSSGIMIGLLVRLPVDHLRLEPASRRPQSPAGWARKVGKNLLGLLLVVIGAVLSLPGVPGQGLLTIFAGVLLLDVPGKHRLERALMSRPLLFRAVNRIRDRFEKPALLSAQQRDAAPPSSG